MPIQDEVPKSRITLTYKTDVNGEESPVNLPFRLLILGDFSGGTSKDSQLDLEERKIRSFDGKNTSEVMKDMDTRLSVVVPNRINPDTSESLRVNLSINHMQAFSPKEVAKQVPQIRSLMMLKQLLLELQANIANKKELSAVLNKLYSDKEAFQTIKEKLKDFSIYQLPMPAQSTSKNEGAAS